METQVLVHHVKDALTNFYDPTHLQTHPLASLLDLKRGPGELAGESLRQALRAAMEALRPPPSVAPTQGEWLGYRILQMRYIQSCDVGTIRQELGLSEATYYRHQRQAIEALASVLDGNARPAPSAGARSPMDESAPSQAADEVHEATRLAREAPRPPVRLRQMLDEAVTTFLPLAQQRGISVEIDAPADLPTACVDPAMFHQILLNVLMEGLRHASGSALRIMPILHLVNGRAEPLTIARTRKKAVNCMLREMGKHAGDQPVHVAVCHGDAAEEAEALRQQVAERFDCVELYVTEFTPVMGAHAGPGLLGLAFYTD